MKHQKSLNNDETINNWDLYIGGKRLEPGIVHHEKNRTRPSQTVILPTNISIPRNGQLLHFAIRQLDAIGLKSGIYPSKKNGMVYLLCPL